MRVAMAQTSLHISTISSVSSLLAYTKPGGRLNTKRDAGQVLGHLTHWIFVHASFKRDFMQMH